MEQSSCLLTVQVKSLVRDCDDDDDDTSTPDDCSGARSNTKMVESVMSTCHVKICMGVLNTQSMCMNRNPF